MILIQQSWTILESLSSSFYKNTTIFINRFIANVRLFFFRTNKKRRKNSFLRVYTIFTDRTKIGNILTDPSLQSTFISLAGLDRILEELRLNLKRDDSWLYHSSSVSDRMEQKLQRQLSLNNNSLELIFKIRQIALFVVTTVRRFSDRKNVSRCQCVSWINYDPRKKFDADSTKISSKCDKQHGNFFFFSTFFWDLLKNSSVFFLFQTQVVSNIQFRFSTRSSSASHRRKFWIFVVSTFNLWFDGSRLLNESLFNIYLLKTNSEDTDKSG